MSVPVLIRRDSLYKYNFLYILPVIMSLVVNFDGVLSFVLSAQYAPGGFNIFISMVMYCYLALFILTLLIGRKSVPYVNRRFILAVIFLMLSFFFVIVTAYGSQKLSAIYRDLYYLIYFICWLVLFLKLKEVNSAYYDNFIDAFIKLNVIILPVISILLGVGFSDGRFHGLQSVPSMFGNTMALLAVVLIFRFKKIFSFNFFLLFLCVFWIFLAGTRSALLIMLLFVVFLFFKYTYSKSKFVGVVFFSFITFLFVFFSSQTLQGSDLGSVDTNSIRLISTEDLENGSLMSRITWYLILWSKIAGSFLYTGGFGGGSAELRIGVIPHLDFLRFWYDYSIYMVFSFFISIYFCLYKGGGVMYRYFLFLSILILLSTHNVMQAPSLMLVFIICLVPVVSVANK